MATVNLSLSQGRTSATSTSQLLHWHFRSRWSRTYSHLRGGGCNGLSIHTALSKYLHTRMETRIYSTSISQEWNLLNRIFRHLHLTLPGTFIDIFLRLLLSDYMPPLNTAHKSIASFGCIRLRLSDVDWIQQIIIFFIRSTDILRRDVSWPLLSRYKIRLDHSLCCKTINGVGMSCRASFRSLTYLFSFYLSV